MKALALILSLALSACVVHPFTYGQGQHQLASLGWSMATKSDRETATITAADGTRLAYSIDKHDGATVPVDLIKAGLLKSAISNSAATARTAIKAPNTGTAQSMALPVLAGGLVGAGVHSMATPAQQQIPLPVIEARNPNATTKRNQ